MHGRGWLSATVTLTLHVHTPTVSTPQNACTPGIKDMGGGQSNTKEPYQVNDAAEGVITDLHATSQETLIKAQLKARKNRMKEKKVRKKGIKGTTGLDISSTGSMHHMHHTDKGEESVKVITDLARLSIHTLRSEYSSRHASICS